MNRPQTDRAKLSGAHGGTRPFALAAVFAGIGTSPLYTLKEAFSGVHPLSIDALHVLGVISLIFWALTIVVTVKYVQFVLRADNRGEGGALALLSRIGRKVRGTGWSRAIVLSAILSTALLYGDAVITPAISVLSATEGLAVLGGELGPLILPTATVILVALFLLQARGAAGTDMIFGSVMLIYLVAIAALGVGAIIEHPGILFALNPIHAVTFFAHEPAQAFLALGSVVLAVTGAEALYAAMGGFGRKSIARGWLYFVFPCLVLNYLGQGALLIASPDAVRNPFFLLAPDELRLPLVLLSIAAAIVASQTVIAGAFAATRQAIQLGFLPRMYFRYTSVRAADRIFVPTINRVLLVLVVVLTLSFGNASNLAAAYGVAVTGTMLITSCMLGALAWLVWRWNVWLAGLMTGAFLVVDGAFLASNLSKIPQGGWFPLVVAALVFVLLTTWATGRRLMHNRQRAGSTPIEHFISSTASRKRVPGNAVFMSGITEGAPPALLHNLKHNKILHERNIVLAVVVDSVPAVGPDERGEAKDLGSGFYEVRLHYGFAEDIDVPRDLPTVLGTSLGTMDTSYFLGRETLVPAERPGMALWREKLFAWMVRNSESATEFYKLPSNRVVELGSQVEI